MAESHDADEQRLEEIVAYLDGELSPEASARVEQQLAADESFRQQLQGIDRAWKALDELPLTTVDDRFSRTTMELAVQAAQAELQERTDALPIVRRRLRVSTILTGVAAAALGFTVVRLAWRQPDQQLLADLPVVENVDVYSQFREVEFLRALRREFGDQLDQLAGKAEDLQEQTSQFQTVANADTRDAWLRGLNDAERTNLRAKYYRFRELPPEEQERLRKLHEQIIAAQDAPELERTMLAYHAWLSGLPQAQQFELRQTQDIDERVLRIRRWSDRMREDALLTLSEEELRKFLAALRQPMQEFREAMNERMGDGRTRGNGQGRGPYWAPRQFAEANARMAKFEQAVLEALPERVREPYKNQPPQQKFQQLATWMRQAESLGRGQISQQALEQFFAEELDAETRENLLSLPPEQMQQALEWRYRRQTGLGFDRRWWDDRDAGDRDGPEGRGEHRGSPGERGEGRPRGPGGRGPGPGFGPPDEFGPRGARGPMGEPDGPRPRPENGPPGGPPGFGFPPPPEGPPVVEPKPVEPSPQGDAADAK